MKNNVVKLLIVILLIIVIIIVIIAKNNMKQDVANKTSVEEIKSQPSISAIESISNEPQQKEDEKSVKIGDDSSTVSEEKAISEADKNNSIKSQIQPETKEEKEKQEIDKDTVAIVNNFKITESYLNEKFNALPDQLKSTHKNDKEGLLGQLIIREVLFQDAEKKGFMKDLDNIQDEEQKKDKAINNFITDLTQKIEISEEEIEDQYQDRISEMKGASLDEVKSDLRNYLIQQKKTEMINQYIEELKNNAKIIKNDRWIAEQQALKPSNPLDTALKNGKPTVLDLGAGKCIPCKMMVPILEELKKEYAGRLNVEFIDVWQNPIAGKAFDIKIIPTQIFYNNEGKEIFRHEGFFSKEDILNKWKELGIKI